MGFFCPRVLYTALFVFANAVGGVHAADIAALEAMREGDMRKLTFHAEPKPVADVEFGDLDGGSHRLADYHGRWVLLNFWATWCVPCRKEMPMLANLQAEMEGETFAVVTLATGRNVPQAIDRFFEEIGVTTLPRFVDPRHGVAASLGIVGLPVTVILDPEGREVARLIGEAEWDGENAKAILMALMAGG
jgi:thiol-disulfide isomerase/thioredoxin